MGESGVGLHAPARVKQLEAHVGAWRKTKGESIKGNMLDNSLE